MAKVIRKLNIRFKAGSVTHKPRLTHGRARGSKALPKENMRCPKCGSQDDKVIDSRSSGDGGQIRRRRECLQCATRFTTYEQIHRENLRIQKRNGQYEAFDRAKL